MTTHHEIRDFNRSAAAVDRLGELARKLTRRDPKPPVTRSSAELVEAGEYLYSIACCTRARPIHIFAGVEAACGDCGSRFYAATPAAAAAADRLAIERARGVAEAAVDFDNPGAVAFHVAGLTANLEGLARRLERRIS